MPPRVSLLLRLLVVAGGVLLAAFTLPDSGPSYTMVWPWFFYAQLGLLLPWLWLGGRALATGGGSGLGRPIDALLLAGVAWFTLAAVTSPFPKVSLTALPALLLFPAAAWVLSGWLTREPALQDERRRKLAHLLGLATSVVCVAALGWWLRLDVIPAVQGGASLGTALAQRNLHSLGHWNYTGACGLLALAISLPGVLRDSGRERTRAIVGLLLGGATLATSGSRGALAGVGVLFVVVLIAEARRRRWSRGRGLAAVVIALLLVLAAGGLHPRGRALLSQWRQQQTFGLGDRQRFAMAEAGWAILRDHPWLGIGPGATPRVYPEYRSRLSGGVESALQLHNTPLQLAVDGGVPALAGWLVAGIIALARAWRRAADSTAALIAAGALAGYGVFSLTDYQLDVPWFGAVLGALLALVPRPGATDTAPASSRSAGPATPPSLVVRGLGIAGLAAVAALVVTQQSTWRARAAFALAFDELMLRQREAYEAGLREARELDPDETYYLNSDGLVRLDPQIYFLAVPLGSPAERLAAARATLEESLRRNPAQEIVHFNLGWALVASEPAAAAGHFRAAAQLVPDKGGVYYGLGLAWLGAGREADAVEAWSLELVNDPAFAASPVWQTDRLHRWAAPVRTRAIARLEASAAQLAGTPGPFARRARAAAAILRWLEGDDAALQPGLLESDPLAREMLRWLSGGTPDRTICAGRTLVAAEVVAAADPVTARRILQRCLAESPRPPPDETLDALLQFMRGTPRRAWLLPPALPRQLIHQERRQRPAYNQLMKNLDGPVPRDLYLVQENRVVHEFLPGLFPEKGYLPGPILAGQLAPLPR